MSMFKAVVAEDVGQLRALLDADADVNHGEQPIGGSGGSLEPPGPLS